MKIAFDLNGNLIEGELHISKFGNDGWNFKTDSPYFLNNQHTGEIKLQELINAFGILYTNLIEPYDYDKIMDAYVKINTLNKQKNIRYVIAPRIEQEAEHQIFVQNYKNNNGDGDPCDFKKDIKYGIFEVLISNEIGIIDYAFVQQLFPIYAG